jgi:DNA (cytosine-5)-methyltransferase 1
LLAKKNEELLRQILKQFEDLGYTVDAKVLSAEQFGTPQRRRRTIILGYKNGLRPFFPLPTHGINESKSFVTIGDAFSRINCKNINHNLEFAKITNELTFNQIKHIPEGCSVRKQADEERYLPKELYFNVDWKNLREKRFREARLYRLDRKKVSPTILTSKRSFFHPCEDRYLPPRESAALQSFPLDFEFTGNQGAIYKQIGNAVPVELAKSVGVAIIKTLNSTLPHSKIKTRDLQQIKENAFNYKKEQSNE